MTTGKKLDPKLAEKVMLKAGLKPLEPYINSTTNWKCKCLKCGSIVTPKYQNVKRLNAGCKTCRYIKMANSNRNSEEKVFTLMLKAGLEPLEPYINSGKPWKCKCLKCGDIVKPNFDSIRNGQGGCKSCGYEIVGNKLRTDAAEAIALMNKNGLQPLEPFKSGRKPWKSKCLKCEHVVSPRYKSIKLGQGACEYCSGTKIDPQEAINFMISRNLKPLEPFKKSRSRWKCKCLKCGDIVYPLLNSIKNGQGGCANCGLKARADKLRYTNEEAVAIFLNAGLEPLEPYVNSELKWKSKCLKCANIVFPTFHNINSGAGGCAFCSEIGFNHNKPAYLYIIFHNEFNSIKVGIGNTDSRPDRIKSFLKNDWQLFNKYSFDIGNYAWKIEVDVLRWLRKDLKLPQHLTLNEMRKTGGQSETVSGDSITILEIQQKVEELLKDYRN